MANTTTTKSVVTETRLAYLKNLQQHAYELEQIKLQRENDKQSTSYSSEIDNLLKDAHARVGRQLDLIEAELDEVTAGIARQTGEAQAEAVSA